MEDLKSHHEPYYFFIHGALFGVLQICLFLTVECYLTATSLGYFFVVMGWLCGLIFFLRSSRKITSLNAITIALCAYYFAYFLLHSLNFSMSVNFILVFVLAMTISLPAAYLFRNFKTQHSASFLFFNENNGFILGYILSLFFFMKWGNIFLQIGPALFYVMTALIILRQAQIVLGLKLLLSFYFYHTNNSFIFYTWITFVLLSMASHTDLFIRKLSLKPKTENVSSASPQKNMTRNRTLGILFLAGFNLIVLQFFISREFSTILAASELSIILIAVVYFLGMTVGFGLGRKLSERTLGLIAIFMFVLHMMILTSIRLFAGYLIASGFGFVTLLILLITTTLFTSAFYAFFLPRFCDAAKNSELENSYSYEIFGSIIGIVFIILSSQYRFIPVLLVYLSLFLIILILLIKSKTYQLGILMLGIPIILFQHLYGESVSKAVHEDYYESRGLHDAELLFSGNSFYHDVDIVKSRHDNHHIQTSFLNGVKYFETRYKDSLINFQESSLSEFTYFLAELPVKYLYRKLNRKLDVLILGGGSMYSIGRVSEYSKSIDLVEIDPLVIESAQKYWKTFNQYDKVKNSNIIIDDAKHYVKNTKKKYDVIILDISAPYYLGTALLHNSDFFKLIRPLMTSNGIFSESTQGRARKHDINGQGMKILKAYSEIFKRFTLIDTNDKPRGDHGYIYAHKNRGLDRNFLKNILIEDNYIDGSRIYSHKDPMYYTLRDTTGFSLKNMEHLFWGNKERIMDRLSSKDSHYNSMEDFLRKLCESKTAALVNKLEVKNHVAVFILVSLTGFGLAILGILRLKRT